VNPRSRLTESALASLSMGYEIGVTPIQMATAVSAVANGGLLVEPHIVRAEIRDGVRREVQPHILRRAITPETAATITTMMEGVVALKQGTGNLAALERYRVAGKTGTANKAIKGGYSKTDYNVSFVGFVPSRDPVFTILVVVDSPQVGSKYGGTVAAPVFKRVAEAALQYLGVQPSIDPAPPVMVAPDQSLLPRVAPRSTPAVPTLTQVGGRPIMPDLRGMTLREAVRTAGTLGLPLTSMEGDGVVVSQVPEAGSVLGPASRGSILLRRVVGVSSGSNR
jgi:cell division protein FtsI (penicillin-binding protein 3)